MNWAEIGVVFGYVVVALTVLVTVLLVVFLFIFSIKGDYQEETRSKMTGGKNIDSRK
ncbi:MAG: adenylate cyclase [Rhodococcus sp.]|nr:adenylate cyclase [Rhodococcus sp. (in: high G+C Gram-positive bacteria)]